MSRKHALQIFRAALDAADPEQAVARHLKFDGRTLTAGRRRYQLAHFDRVRVIGAGKASAAMAKGVERILGRRVAGGLVNVPDRVAAELRRIELNPSGHPIPDERGMQGAQRIVEIARESGPRDLLICVISGGASALLPLPAESITLAEKREITQQLLARGATIHQINTVRKHISQIKGGHLAEMAFPATLITLILSDVIGDNLNVIGSGPTVPDPSTCDDALRIAQKFEISLPARALRETPKPGDPTLARVQNLIVGSNRLAIDAAAKKARALGWKPLVLSTFIDGETRDIAAMHAAIAKEILTSGRPARPPVCVLSGGETTVTIRGKGLGGRNQEFVLAALLALDGLSPVMVFSAGTDGIDGPTDAAGAVADASALQRARELKLDPRSFLNNNDSYHCFEGLKNALVKTGPTGTNVMDIRLLLIGSP